MISKSAEVARAFLPKVAGMLFQFSYRLLTSAATVALLFATGLVCCRAGTNEVHSTNSAATTNMAATSLSDQTAQAQRAEQLRMTCIEGRRYISGRVLQILPEGLVVDSGYSALLNPPFNQSWVVRANVSVSRSPGQIEEKKPDAVCVGLVLLSDIPKRPAVKNFDYVVIHGYPAGQYAYAPVPGVRKSIRRFSASLEHAVTASMSGGEK